MIKLGAKSLRVTKATGEQRSAVPRNPIYIICDNILDTYNVGSIFRLADAVAAERVYLCGITETPPNTRIKKASINTTEWVEWEYVASTLDAIKKLREQFSRPVILGTQSEAWRTPESKKEKDSGQARMTNSKIQIVAVEQNAKSVPFNKAEYSFPIALIVSNEQSGASKEVLDKADMIVEMPMFGVNKSLNVMVSLGIVLYQALSNKVVP